MKKTILIVALVLLALGGLGVGAAFAQGSIPPYAGHGPMVANGAGWMHDYIERALTSKLGVTEAQVDEQFAAGKSMYQIALDNGIQQVDVVNFIDEVHQQALANAVRDGVLTQTQADWLSQRMQNAGQNGYGFANCPMGNAQGTQFGLRSGRGGGMMGRGFGWQNQQDNP